MNKDIEILENEINSLKAFIAKEKGKEEQITKQLSEYIKKKNNLDIKIELLEKVIILYQKTSEFAREQAKTQIENLVTKSIQFIFESDAEFSIEIEELRNKANASFYIIDEIDGVNIKTKPELSRGGGVVDIVSLALRIAFLEINKPSIEGPLILDEPAKHVSEEYIYNVGEFLKESCNMFNRQIIMVTHNQHLSALSDHSYRVDMDGSKSVVTKVEP